MIYYAFVLHDDNYISRVLYRTKREANLAAQEVVEIHGYSGFSIVEFMVKPEHTQD